MANLYHGSLVFTDDATTTIVTGGTYVKAANTSKAVECYGFSHSQNRLTFTGNEQRTVMVLATVSMETSAATNPFLTIFKGGLVEEVDAAIKRTVNVGTDTGAVACHLMVKLKKDEYVEVWVTTDDGDEVDIVAGGMSAWVVG